MKLPLVRVEDGESVEQRNETKLEEATDLKPREPFEYERYSDDELKDVYKHIDREANSEQFQKLVAEMEKRDQAGQGACHNADKSAS
ncbi:hypothetical protein [Pelagicoccus mobilis]|uniref:Uncharacterized protein n=1 Tax=Pelagicoccus mobilis TaxID=415221 RepID=A0A934VP65_9BACT|nr:hypothetical protein [Pelagicoccus mobilis]MBK1880656.1 hypothetical protein [Pelagicoccus mobilis]